MALCQQCGRAANYARRNTNKYRGTKKNQRTTGRADHDLCRRCWKKLMDSIRATED